MPHINLQKNTCIALLVLFLLTCYAYYIPYGNQFQKLIIIEAGQFLLLLCIAYINKNNKLSIPVLFLFAIACRLVICFSTPTLENDYLRYLWDGRVLAHGINPYLYSPIDPALNFLSTEYRTQIDCGYLKTVYPPGAQAFFALIHFLSQDSILGLKTVFILFDLMTGFVLMKWLKHSNKSMLGLVFYLFNPLVLKEISNSAHYDSIAVFFLVLAMYFFITKLKIIAWFFLSIATSLKLFPLILIPIFIKLDQKWKKHLCVFVLALIVIYLPFIGARENLFEGVLAYSKYWTFNASIYYVLVTVFSPVINIYIIKCVLACLLIVLVIWKIKTLQKVENIANTALVLIGGLLVFSPVLNPWYVLWYLPFACLTLNFPWLLFSALAVISYSWFQSRHLAISLRILEYLPFFLTLAYKLYRDRI